jgi:DNA-binding NtrC family response regulator
VGEGVADWLDALASREDVSGVQGGIEGGVLLGDGGDLNLERTERALVEAALKRHAFNISRAAADLGLTRTALYRRMAKYGF